MAGGLLLASQFLAGGLLLVLAVGLLAIKFGSRVNRAFALCLLLEGATILLLNLGRLQDETDPGDLWLRLAYYPLIVLPLALLHFLLVYRRPASSGGAVAVSLALAAVGLAMVLAHALDRCAYACVGPDGQEAGPLLAFAGLKPLFQALVALVLVLDVRRGSTVRGRGVLLVAMAFGLLASFDAGLGVFRAIAGPLADTYARGPWILLNRLLQFPAFAVAVGALALAHRTLQGGPSAHHSAALLAGTFVAVLASAVLIVVAPDSGTSSWGTLVAGFWRTLMPAVVAYALIRHRLFGIELKIRSSLAIALVAATFGATYFLVSEGLEALVSSRFGTIGGLTAAALLALLGKPITVAARRIAAFLVPTFHAPGGTLSGIAIYRAQFVLFQEDGILTAKERRLLDHLRGSLGVSEVQALRVERELSGRAADNWSQSTTG